MLENYFSILLFIFVGLMVGVVPIALGWLLARALRLGVIGKNFQIFFWRFDLKSRGGWALGVNEGPPLKVAPPGGLAGWSVNVQLPSGVATLAAPPTHTASSPHD